MKHRSAPAEPDDESSTPNDPSQLGMLLRMVHSVLTLLTKTSQRHRGRVTGGVGLVVVALVQLTLLAVAVAYVIDAATTILDFIAQLADVATTRRMNA